MVRNVFRNGQKIVWIGCACIGTYIAYRYWKRRELLAIDEGFEEVSKVRSPFLCSSRFSTISVVLDSFTGSRFLSVTNINCSLNMGKELDSVKLYIGLISVRCFIFTG